MLQDTPALKPTDYHPRASLTEVLSIFSLVILSRMLAKKTKYALKALMVLAKEDGQGPVLIADIAEREGIPKKFLEIILLELKNQGMLQSKKGKGGGYFLARPARQISVGRVIRVLEGPIAPLPCVSRTAYMRCRECRDERTCAIRMVMKELRDASAKILDSTTLADMLKRVQVAVQGKEALSFAI